MKTGWILAACGDTGIHRPSPPAVRVEGPLGCVASLSQADTLGREDSFPHQLFHPHEKIQSLGLLERWVHCLYFSPSVSDGVPSPVALSQDQDRVTILVQLRQRP